MTLRLIVSLTVAASLLWCAAVGFSSYVSYRELNHAFDRALREVAYNMLPLAAEFGQEHEVDDSRVLRQILAQDQVQLSYQVRNAQGRLIMRANDAFLTVQPTSVAPGYSNAGGYRLFTVSDDSSGLTVTVAERTDVRWRSVASGAIAMLWPLALLIPVNIVLVIWQVRSAMRPLHRLSDEVSTRSGDNMQPIDVCDQPVELEPIARSVAQLLGRLNSTLKAERSFTSNSAHELRTPIAAALAQTQRLIAEVHEPAAKRRAEQIEGSLKSLANLASKLLELARLDAHSAPLHTPCDLLPILDLLVTETQRQLPRSADLQFLRNGVEQLQARTDPDAFAIAIRNLLENAVRHRAGGAWIQVEIQPTGNVKISNPAPLIGAGELAQLTQRFTRGENSGGSGLGLAIASTIAAQQNAQLELRSFCRDEGAVFEVEWGFLEPAVVTPLFQAA